MWNLDLLLVEVQKVPNAMAEFNGSNKQSSAVPLREHRRF